MKRSWKLLRELFLFSTNININASNVDVIQKQWMLFNYFGSLWIRGNLKFLSSLPLTIFRVAVKNAKTLSLTHISAWNFKLKLLHLTTYKIAQSKRRSLSLTLLLRLYWKALSCLEIVLTCPIANVNSPTNPIQNCLLMPLEPQLPLL